MKNILYSIKMWMKSRYGTDELSWVLLIIAVIISLIGKVTGLKFIYYIAYAAFIISILRSYSSNYEKRMNELAWYKDHTRGIRAFFTIIVKKFKDKEHLYVQCPKCHTVLRVPKGKGNIVITCSNCQNKIQTKS